MLHLVLQLAHVVGHGVHTERIESAVEHVCLYSHLVERLAESSHRMVRVLASQEVHLFEGTAVSLHTVEDSHVDYGWRDSFQLVLAWLELTGALPHVSVYETELDSLFHSL